MCGFNKMVPQRTLQTSQLLLFETCFLGTRAVAPSLSRSFNVWFFPLGYFKSCVYTHKPRTLNDLKEAIRQEIRPIDRQLLVCVMDDLKNKKGLKTASKKTVVILPISFLKLNHLVCHVLCFNFV